MDFFFKSGSVLFWMELAQQGELEAQATIHAHLNWFLLMQLYYSYTNAMHCWLCYYGKIKAFCKTDSSLSNAIQLSNFIFSKHLGSLMCYTLNT